MPPKSKNKKNKAVRNGYFYFMQDIREKERMKGHYFPSQKEVADFCAPLWANLLPEEKDEYNDLAKQKKLEEKQAVDEAATKFNSFGISLAYQDAEIRQQQEQEMIMKIHIKNLMSSAGRNGIMTQKFYLCHVNYGFKVNEDKYAPVEIAIAEFSLYDGITDRFHTFLNPGKIPLGLRYEAIEWSSMSHNIPIESNLGENIDKEVLNSIINFLKRDETESTLPVIYTMPDSLNSNDSFKAVVSAMNQICEAGQVDPDLFRIYSLPHLFYELRNKSAEGGEPQYSFPSIALATEILQQHIYCSFLNMACNFHIENDNELKCSLGSVTRWAYTICDHCCDFLGIEAIPGQHIPIFKPSSSKSIQQPSRLRQASSVESWKKPAEKVVASEPEEVFTAPEEVSGAPIIASDSKPVFRLSDSIWYPQAKAILEKTRKALKEQEDIQLSVHSQPAQANNKEMINPQMVQVSFKEATQPPKDSSDGYKFEEDEFPDLGGKSRVGKKENAPPQNAGPRTWGNPWRK